MTPIGSQRIPSVPRDGWTNDVRDVFAIYEGQEAWENGSKYNFMHWFANHPTLAQSWLKYNFTLTRGQLDPQLREIVILRVSHRYHSEYEWTLHVDIAAAVGLGPDYLEAVKEGADAAIFTDLQRLGIRAADQLCLAHDIDDELWGQLAEHLDKAQLMELLFLIGSYSLLAWVLRAVRLPVEHTQA
ncbi:MAG TPA: carboxymuconolactone decarboxylase family protein [Sphingobium sp.]|uniref:carboxymuconolactone decarboxylase family protein n=1 Tax=Sphingobium sp. TaxID=1912891 RepID=UPI002ED0AFD8